MPVVIIYGAEQFLAEDALKRLRAERVNPAMAALTHRILKRPRLADVLEVVGSASLALGGHTVVELHDLPQLAEAAKDEMTDAQLQDLREMLQLCPDNKTVVFVAQKLDGKIKFPKWLVQARDGFTVHKCDGFKFWEGAKAAQWLVQYARKADGPNIQPGAAELLVDALGVELRPLVNAWEKLALLSPGREITRAEAAKLDPHSDNVFRIVDNWVLQREPAENIRALSDILLQKYPVMVFGAVQSYFNNLFRVCWLAQRGHSPDAISKVTGQTPYRVNENLKTFRRVPVQRWIALKHHLAQMEWYAKSGQLNGELALQSLLGL